LPVCYPAPARHLDTQRGGGLHLKRSNAMSTTIPAATPPQLFRLNAKYQINPVHKPGDLLNDASCFLDSAHGVVMSLIDDTGDMDRCVVNALYAAGYLLEMVAGLISAVQLETHHV